MDKVISEYTVRKVISKIEKDVESSWLIVYLKKSYIPLLLSISWIMDTDSTV